VTQGVKKIIEACIHAWSNIIADADTITREKVVKILKESYRKFKVKPLKDYAKTGLYEREIITLYVVGKYGLNIIDEMEYISDIFNKEKKYERLYLMLTEKCEDPELNRTLDSLSAETVLKTARFGLIMSLLGFASDSRFLEIMSCLIKLFPKYSTKLYKLAKIFIALEIAKKVSEGVIKNRFEKEALKQALCMKINSPKVAPSDKMIYQIAKYYFGVSEEQAFQVLNVKDSILAKI